MTVLLPAMRHLPQGDTARLLVVRRGRELDACLPVLPRARWRRKVPVPALVSWNHDYQLLGTPLVDRDRTREAGFDAHLTKPVSMEHLLGVLQQAKDRTEAR